MAKKVNSSEKFDEILGAAISIPLVGYHDRGIFSIIITLRIAE